VTSRRTLAIERIPRIRAAAKSPATSTAHSSKKNMENPAIAIGVGTTDVDSFEAFEHEMGEPNQKPIPEFTFREKFNVWFDYTGERVPFLNFL
jgi:hypothetical protein